MSVESIQITSFGQEMATVDTSATKPKGKTERDPPYLGVVLSF